jgi:hypothetical protein
MKHSKLIFITALTVVCILGFNFKTYSQPPISITGSVFDTQGNGISGITIEFNGNGPNNQTGQQTSGESGSYAYMIQGYDSLGWSGEIRAIKAGYQFDTTYNYVNLTDNLTELDFTGTLIIHTISGALWDTIINQPVIDAFIKVNDIINDTTNSDGSYAFQQFHFDNITITPEKAGYVFDPVNITIDSIINDFPNQNFNGSLKSYKISGMVELAGVGIDSTQLIFSTNDTLIDDIYFLEVYEAYTNDTGYYEAELYHGWNGTITPYKYIHSFNPSFHITDSLTGSITRNFDATLHAPLFLSLENIEICLGEGATLKPTVVGGAVGNYFYEWKTGDLIIGYDSILFVSPEITTNYIITVNDGTNSASETAIVTVHPLPEYHQIIQNDPEICQNQRGTRFSTDTLAHHSYIWSIEPEVAGTIFAHNQGACIVNWNAAGTDSPKLMLKVLNQNGCEIISEHDLTFESGIVPQTEILRKSNSNLLYCDSLANATYIWGFSPLSDPMFDSVVQTGAKHYCYFDNLNPANYYWVEIETENTCQTRIYCNTELVGTVAQEIPNVSVRPVPFDDFLEIHIPQAISGRLSITINDMMGRDVLNAVFKASNNNTYHINTINVLPGIYILIIQTDSNYRFSQKVIKF